MTGESYAGVYIPTLAMEILKYNSLPSKELTINLKGMMIGNGCTHESECSYLADYWPFHVTNFLGGHNLISPETNQLI